MKMKLTIEVEYDGDDEVAATSALHTAADVLVEEGLLSEGTDMEVESWEAKVEVVPEEEDESPKDYPYQVV